MTSTRLVVALLAGLLPFAAIGGQDPLRVVFGTQSSRTAAGLIRASPDSAFDDEKGFGWLNNRDLTGSDTDGPDAALPGYVTGMLKTENPDKAFVHIFRVKVQPGIYRVTVTSGRRSMDVPTFFLFAQGKKEAPLTSGKGAFTKKTLAVETLSGDLDLGFGFDWDQNLTNWLVNGLEIVPERVYTEKTPDEIREGARLAYAPWFSQKPKIDGKLDDACWKTAVPLDTFIRNTEPFTPAAKPTRVWLGRDAAQLYVGFECSEPNMAKLRQAKAPPDSKDLIHYVFGNDCVELFLMPQPASATWYHLALDAASQWWGRKERTKKDEEKVSTDEQVEFTPFSSRLTSAVQLNQDSWNVEMAVPLADLGVMDPDLAKQEWRVNFCREEKPAGELSSWSRVVGSFLDPSRFGRMIFTETEECRLGKAIYAQAVAHFLDARQQQIASETLANQQRAYAFAHAFSFGPADAPLKPGYRRVAPQTAYSAASGFGWVGDLSGLEARYKRWNGKGRWLTMYTEELTSGCIVGTSSPDPETIEHTFRIDLPNGDYKVHLIMGEAAKETVRSQRRFEVYANDRRVFPVEVGGTVFAQPYFRATVTDGALRLRLRGQKKICLDLSPELREMVPDEMKTYVPGWVVNAVVVYPAAERKAAESQLAKDERDFNLLPTEKLALVKEIAPPTEEPLKDLRPEEKERGYILFTRDVCQPIYRTSWPQRSEIVDPVSFRVTPGETTTVSLGVQPLRALDRFEISVSDLKGPGGLLKADRIEIGLARITPHGDETKYTMISWIVEPIQFADGDLNEGETRQVLLTVRVPPDLKPGNYSGSVQTRVTGGKAYRLGLRAEILPFVLPEARKRFGAYLPEGYGTQWLHTDQHLASMRDHGFNTVEFNGGDMADMKAKLRLAKRYGLAGPIPLAHCWLAGERTSLTDAERKQLIGMVTEVRDYAKQNGLPEPLFYAWDELLTQWMIQVAIDTYRTAKSVEGVRTFETCTPSSYSPVAPYVDIPCLTSVPDFRKYRVNDADRKKGKEIWTYSNWVPPSANLGAIRFNYGWFLWSVGLDGDIPWAYMTFGSNPYNWFVGRNWMFCVPRAVGGYAPLPTLGFELTRMGINDSRYLQLLADLIEEGQRSGDAKTVALAREEAAQLSKITDSVQGSIEYYEGYGYWKPEIYGKLRSRMVESILKLLQAQGKIPKVTNPSRSVVSAFLARLFGKTTVREAAWWNGDWHYRIPVTVDAGMNDRQDGLVFTEVNFTALLKEAGVSGPVDPDSIRLIECEAKPVAAEIPIALRASADGRGRIIWRMSGTLKALEQRVYHLYFDLATNGKKPKPAYEPPVKDDVRLPGENLVVNGDFSDELNGWKGRDRVAVDRTEKHDGHDTLKLVDRAAISQHVPLQEGKKYNLSCWMKVERPADTKPEGAGLFCSMWLGRQGGEPGQLASNYKYQFGVNTPGDWLYFESSTFCYYSNDKKLVFDKVTLPGTAEGILEIGAYVDGGVFHLSDVKVTEITDDPVRITLQPLERK